MQHFGKNSRVVRSALIAGGILLLLLCHHGNLPAQPATPAPEDQKFHIQKIVVLGNARTRARVILREMKTQEGDTVSVAELEADRRRIESLQLFTRVQMQLAPLQHGFVLEIYVSEQWYFFPFPILFFNEHEISLKKLSFGAGVVHTNFRGLAEVLEFSGWMGYNPALYLRYRNPWMFGDARLFTNLQFFISRIKNKSLQIRKGDADEKRFGAGLTVGKRLTLHTSVSGGVSYSEVRLQADSLQLTLSPSQTDKLLQFSVNIRHDHRDLAWYPTRGWFLNIEGRKVGWPGAKYIDYSRMQIDLRKYFPLWHNAALGVWGLTDLSSGRIPAYDRVFFGYDYRIRGYFSRRFEGENMLISALELRFPLVPVRYFNLDSKTLGPYGQNLPFGISGNVFFELGSLWFQRRQRQTGDIAASSNFYLQTSPRRRLWSYGVGLSLHLPYVQIARSEFAINKDGRTELIFSVGVAF